MGQSRPVDAIDLPAPREAALGGCALAAHGARLRASAWGELDIAVRERLSDVVDAIRSGGVTLRAVEVDLRAVTLLASVAIAWLFELQRAVSDAGADFTVLVDRHGAAAHTLQLAGLSRSLSLHERPPLRRARDVTGAYLDALALAERAARRFRV